MTAPGRLVHEQDAPAPARGHGEVVLDLLACGVGLTQLQTLDGRLGRGPLPRVLGHEIVGTVRSVDDDAPVSRGDVVVMDPFLACGSCLWCTGGQDNLCPSGRFLGIDADGGFADTAAFPVANAIAVPSSVPVFRAVLAASALPTAVHAIGRAGRIRDATIAVVGLGSIGVLVAQVARLLGAARVVGADTLATAVTAASPFVDAGVHLPGDDGDRAGELIRASAGAQVDVVVEAAGGESAVHGAVAAVRPGGTVVLVGLGHQVTRLSRGSLAQDVVHPELTLAASYGYRRTDVRAATRLVSEGRVEVDGLIGATLTLAEVPGELDRLRREGTGGRRSLVLW